jgi:hypothetical protein
MTWNLQNPIPTDSRVLVTSGTECALYVDGQLTSCGDPATSGSNTLQMSATVRELIRLAGVTLIENVDNRLIVDPDRTRRDPVRRLLLSEVEATRAQLAKVAQLRAESVRLRDEADQIEALR